MLKTIYSIFCTVVILLGVISLINKDYSFSLLCFVIALLPLVIRVLISDQTNILSNNPPVKQTKNTNQRKKTKATNKRKYYQQQYYNDNIYDDNFLGYIPAKQSPKPKTTRNKKRAHTKQKDFFDPERFFDIDDAWKSL